MIGALGAPREQIRFTDLEATFPIEVVQHSICNENNQLINGKTEIKQTILGLLSSVSGSLPMLKDFSIPYVPQKLFLEALQNIMRYGVGAVAEGKSLQQSPHLTPYVQISLDSS